MSKSVRVCLCVCVCVPRSGDGLNWTPDDSSKPTAGLSSSVNCGEPQYLLSCRVTTLIHSMPYRSWTRRRVTFMIRLNKIWGCHVVGCICAHRCAHCAYIHRLLLTRDRYYAVPFQTRFHLDIERLTYTAECISLVIVRGQVWCITAPICSFTRINPNESGVQLLRPPVDSHLPKSRAYDIRRRQVSLIAASY